MKIIDWNYERKRTRDRLLEYIIVPVPYSTGLYPLDNLIINMIEETELPETKEE